MLNLLLFHPKYADGSKVYRDEMLATEIRNHFHAIYGQDTELTPGVVARQFSRQILIQPELSGAIRMRLLAMFIAPNSVIDQVASESNHPGEYKRDCPEDFNPFDSTYADELLFFYYIPEVFDRDRYNYSKATNLDG